MTFGEKLQELFDENDGSAAELAETLDLSVRTVKGWLMPSYKNRAPKAETVVNICRIFDRESDYFDECFDDDYARLRSMGSRRRYTRWAGDAEEET